MSDKKQPEKKATPAPEIPKNLVKMSRGKTVALVAPQDIAAFKSAGYSVVN